MTETDQILLVGVKKKWHGKYFVPANDYDKLLNAYFELNAAMKESKFKGIKAHLQKGYSTYYTVTCPITGNESGLGTCCKCKRFDHIKILTDSSRWVFCDNECK